MFYLGTQKTDGTDARLVDLFASWIITLQSTLCKRAVPSYESHVEKFISAQEIQAINDISRRNIQTYVDFLTGKGLSPATVRTHFASISNFCNYLVDDYLLEYSPCVRIRLPSVDLDPPRYLTEEQEGRLIAWSKFYGSYYPIFIALRTAMRMSEIRRMEWQHLDFSQDTITIYSTKNPKRRKFRIIPLHSELKKRAAANKTKCRFYLA